MNIFNIANAYARKEEMNWDKIFWAVDLHGTIIRPNYQNSSTFDFYPCAKEVLLVLSKSKEDSLILYTCSHIPEMLKVLDHFRHIGIIFDYANENLDADNTEYGNYEIKPYFNVLLEDKAGFNGETDWFLVKNELIKLNKWPRDGTR